MGWGLTHLPWSHHCPQYVQPASACPCLVPEGHKDTIRITHSPHAGHTPKRAASSFWGGRSSPRGHRRKTPPQPITLPSFSPLPCTPHSAQSWPEPRLAAPGDCSSSLESERVVGAGQQYTPSNVTLLQGTPKSTTSISAGSQEVQDGNCSPEYPCVSKGTAASLGQSRGRRDQGWGARAGRGVGLQGGAAGLWDSLFLDPCNGAHGREDVKFTPLPLFPA